MQNALIWRYEEKTSGAYEEPLQTHHGTAFRGGRSSDAPPRRERAETRRRPRPGLRPPRGSAPPRPAPPRPAPPARPRPRRAPPAPERRNPTPPRNPQQNKATVNAAQQPPDAAPTRPREPGSPRRRRALGGARTPGLPWCSRCSTGTPGPSPGCWAAKTLREEREHSA